MKILRPFLYFAAFASTALAADSNFDQWTENFSAEWLRANPGQACAYKIDMLKILELREGAASTRPQIQDQ